MSSSLLQFGQTSMVQPPRSHWSSVRREEPPSCDIANVVALLYHLSRATMNDATELFKEQGYLLDDLLATDSWGELYSATYTGHGRRVLFRRFRPALSDPRACGLAAAEIEAWARMDQRAVIQPLDGGAAPAGSYYAAMVPEGLPLACALSEDSGLELFDPEEVFGGVLEAVEAAARWGVLHLGLGLTNVWVTDGAVGVSEFGL